MGKDCIKIKIGQVKVGDWVKLSTDVISSTWNKPYKCVKVGKDLNGKTVLWLEANFPYLQPEWVLCNSDGTFKKSRDKKVKKAIDYRRIVL